VEYIGRKLEKYEEGEDVTSDALMEQADNKFKLLKESGHWNAPSEQEEKILALQSEIKNLKKKTKDPNKKPPYKGKPTDTKGKGKGAALQAEKPSWFFKEPKEDEIHKPKMFNGKPWYYCSKKTGGKCDGQYRRHKPSECEGKAHAFVPKEKKKAEDKDKGNEERKLKLAKAYEATLSASNDDDHTMSD
jgi:hypothetical protein